MSVSSTSNGLKPGVCTSSSRPPAPYVGQVIYETDTGNLLYYYGVTTGWRPPWGQPWGYTGYVTVNANQTGIAATIVDLTSLTITISPPANRRYAINFQGRFTQNTSSGFVEVYITDGANTILNKVALTLAAAATDTVSFFERRTTVSGSQTWKARASTTAGTLTLTAAATQEAMLWIEDIGPNGNAPVS